MARSRVRHAGAVPAKGLPAKGLYDVAARIPPLGRLRSQRDDLAARVSQLEAEVAELTGRLRGAEEHARAADEAGWPVEEAYRLFPPGHYYSPTPDLADVRDRAHRLFDRTGDVAGVDVRLDAQRALLAELAGTIAQWPYLDRAEGDGLRYQPDNGFFGHTDSQLWYGLLRTRRPRRVIEVGSGWSTALTLDTCEAHGLDTDVVAVEPYPERLLSTMSEADRARVTLVQERAQDVAPERLADLAAGDVLFIDSTHVSKLGSDVNHLVFEVFPLLPPGVLVHVHDIAYPFEYPHEWVMEGRAWNEAYLLRAFLMDNPRWEVLLWPSLLWLRYPAEMEAALHDGTPVDGGSLWLRTT